MLMAQLVVVGGRRFERTSGEHIERIEVLRDGAAAQYGSDAIAGVINIILRNDNRLTGAVTVGQNMTGFNGGTVDGRD